MKENNSDYLINVTPISFGTNVEGGIMSIIIPRGTVIPTKMAQTYTTIVDYQK